ncbi:MAG: hypothetical protein ACTMIR_01120 [Cellulomonadaceae bacterium]
MHAARRTVWTHVTLSEFAIVLGLGSPLVPFLGSEAIMTVQVARDDRGWQVRQVDLLALPGPLQSELLCTGVTGCVSP